VTPDVPSVRLEALPGATRAVVTTGILLFLSMLPVTLLVAPLKELIAERYGASAFWTHSFMSVNMIGAVMAAPLLVLLSDRPRARRKVAALALASDAVLFSAMAVSPSLPVILIFRFLEGAAHILALSTLMAIAAGWSGARHRGRTMGIVGAAMMFGTACGTRLGGLVWQHLPGWTFHVAGAISGATALGVMLFAAEGPMHAEDRSRRGLGLVRRNPRLLVPYAYAFVDRFCVGVVISTFVLFLGEVHHLDPGQRSRLLAMFLVPFALVVYPAGRLIDRIGRVWPICAGTAVFGLIFAAYGCVTSAQLPAIMVLSGLVSAVMFAPSLALAADLAPAEQRGAAFTGFNVAGSLGFVLGPLCAGALYSLCQGRLDGLTAYRVTFAATGAAAMACALVTIPSLLRMRAAGETR
jgi:MFS family permease